MRRRTRTRSLLLRAAIGASGLLVALWGLSLKVTACFWPGDPIGIEFGITGGCFGALWNYPHQGPGVWFEQMNSSCYGFELPSAFELPSPSGGSNLHSLRVPIWLPLMVSTSAAVFLWRSGRRTPGGHCEKCGYDLTGNVSGRCPECGEVANQAQAQHTAS
jgi:hypothetical protein